MSIKIINNGQEVTVKCSSLAEAKAFTAGVEFVNDSSIDVFHIRKSKLKDGRPRRINPQWIVQLRDNDETRL